MFKLTQSRPCEIQGTIRIKRGFRGLGPLVDVDGKHWDIYGYGKNAEGWFCWASDDVHPYYTDTSSTTYGLVQQQWFPYRVEIVGED